MPYFPILQKPTQNNLITKTSFRQDAPPRRDASLCEKTAEERLPPPSDCAIYKKPPKSGCIRQHMVGLHSLVAERRHSSITRYAKRSVACRDSPRHQTLRAGGTPLPRHRRLPHPIVRHHPSDCPNGAIHRHAKTAEERFNMLARGWLAYPVTPIHSLLPPKSGCRKHPRRRHCEAQNAAERVPQRGSISAAHSGISEQYRFANIPSVVR